MKIIRATSDHIPEIARIIFEGFRGIHERHHFPLDIPLPEIATRMANMFVTRPDVYGVVALVDGKVVGSNFLEISDPVAGVGPITVDPAAQTRGIGRALMQHVIEWGRQNHGPMIRLMQDSFNMTSLSLYASLGFELVEPVVLMTVPPAESADESVRPITLDEVPACDELCQRIMKVSRKNELSFFVQHGAAAGIVPHGRFADRKLKAYIVPGFLGHGVAESVEDFLLAVTQAARRLGPPAEKVFIPARNGPLFRRALQMKLRGIKLMSLMALGPYEAPLLPECGCAWSPSVAY